MLRHYIKVALRLIRRSLLFSSINLMGFVLGLTAAFLIYLWVVDELTHDDCFRDGSLIYRVTELHREAGGEIKESPRLPRTLAMDFRQKFPQVEDATAIKYGDQYSYEAEGGKKMTVTEVYVDSTFFRFFTFPVVEGTPQRINENPNNVVISAELARKFFGSGSAVGQKLTYSFGNSISDVYTVVAVVDIPRKSHIRFELAMPMEAYGRGGVNINWNTFTESMHVYIKMKEGAAMLRSEAQAMSRLLADRGEKNVRLGFQPLHDIYLHTRFADPDVKQHGNLSTVYLFIALAVLVIFMGAFNFTTLSTARASLRYKEVGVRKVTGAKRRVLIGQFLSEGMVQACIALVLAMALTELTLPLFNRVMETDLRLEASWSVVLYMLFGIVGVGCLAGSYPAFYLSSINPLLAFKGGRKTGRKGGLIRGLVCVQFVIALVLMLLTGIVFKQLHYMQNKDMGLDKENIVCIYTSLWYNVGDFKQELLRNPDIKGVSMSSPIENFGEGTSYKDGNKVEWTDVDGRTDSLRMVQLWADGDFVKTFGMQLVKGKLMDSDFGGYWDFKQGKDDRHQRDGLARHEGGRPHWDGNPFGVGNTAAHRGGGEGLQLPVHARADQACLHLVQPRSPELSVHQDSSRAAAADLGLHQGEVRGVCHTRQHLYQGFQLPVFLRQAEPELRPRTPAEPHAAVLHRAGHPHRRDGCVRSRGALHRAAHQGDRYPQGERCAFRPHRAYVLPRVPRLGGYCLRRGLPRGLLADEQLAQ